MQESATDCDGVASETAPLIVQGERRRRGSVNGATVVGVVAAEKSRSSGGCGCTCCARCGRQLLQLPLLLASTPLPPARRAPDTRPA